MKTSFISALTTAILLPSLSLAGPLKRQAAPPPVFANDLAAAVSAWQLDTAIVSNFLNTGANITPDLAFRTAAVVAFNAEMDELNHKKIIDQVFLGIDPTIQAANNVLATQGNFGLVVQGLADLVANGLADVGKIVTINQGRCANVLPAIDQYFSVVEQNLLNSPQGLTLPVPVGGAFRPPLVCPL